MNPLHPSFPQLFDPKLDPPNGAREPRGVGFNGVKWRYSKERRQRGKEERERNKLVVVENGAPSLSQVGCRARLAVDTRQGVFPVLSRHELDFDPDVSTFPTAKVQRLRIDVQHVPGRLIIAREGEITQHP